MLTFAWVLSRSMLAILLWVYLYRASKVPTAVERGGELANPVLSPLTA